MTDTLSCPDCETEIDSLDELEREGAVSEIEAKDDGSFNLFEKRDLFLCKNCRNPLGVSRS